ncbi:response regulator transcription factor [Actinoplanes sp. NPDC049265]|uniref:response regulator transcription factor n=1 Tax=Actinoplanes sp. NPDC049265 TaxID=3363902 RepID=UPI00371463C8
MTAHVLLAEDNPTQAEVIRRYLEQDGHRTTVVRDGPSALRAAERIRPDLVVLDVMMPGLDGLQVCRKLRDHNDVLVLMLTARSSKADVIRGLEQGADDYLTKPFSPRELALRVRTLLRRAGRTPLGETGIARVGDLAVDRGSRLTHVGDRAVECTPVEFEMLFALASAPGRVLSRAQLLDCAFALHRNASERTVDVHVRNLRQKIEADPARPARLLTVHGLGYKLVDPAAG